MHVQSQYAQEANRQEAFSRMATIRATCSDCGDVELTTDDVRVRVCLEDSVGSYQFRCPLCQMAVVKSAEPRIVEVSMWRLPAELYESRSGPRIDHDDLLDFHELLKSDSWFDDLVRVIDSRPGPVLDAEPLAEPEFDSER
jgi:hypothetical protein